MLKGVNSLNFYEFGEHPFSRVNRTAKRYSAAAIDEEIYGSDEFRMFAYKIKMCTRTDPHDWTECPYAHRGEKAQRRDPRKVPYSSVDCPLFRSGNCPKGDSCKFAHGVFEYWLHPARYRTRACTAGMFCQRKVCFFAHTAEQLRLEPRLRCHFVYQGGKSGGDNQYQYQYHLQHNQDAMRSGSSGGQGEISVSAASGAIPESPSSVPTWWRGYRYEEVEEVLNSLRGMEISGQ